MVDFGASNFGNPLTPTPDALLLHGVKTVGTLCLDDVPRIVEQNLSEAGWSIWVATFQCAIETQLP